VYSVQCNREAIEIARIVAPDESLLHEDHNEYIVASFSNGCNTAYRTASLEVYLRAGRFIARQRER